MNVRSFILCQVLVSIAVACFYALGYVELSPTVAPWVILSPLYAPYALPYLFIAAFVLAYVAFLFLAGFLTLLCLVVYTVYCASVDLFRRLTDRE